MKQHRHSALLSYPHTFGERVYSLFLIPLAGIALLFIALKVFHIPFASANHFSLANIFLAGVLTFSRLLVAYALALIVSIPLALLATSSEAAEKIFLPFFDILESIPTLAFFPVLIFLFVKLGALNIAAICILFLSMVWNMVFTLVGGIKIIPKDITYAAEVFHVTGWNYVRKVILPAIFPEMVTGSILAFAQGWNLIIVAEVMHVYIPGGTVSQDLPGLGSMLVNASAGGESTLFALALFVMVIIIALENFFVWQKLLHLAQKFKFE